MNPFSQMSISYLLHTFRHLKYHFKVICLWIPNKLELKPFLHDLVWETNDYEIYSIILIAGSKVLVWTIFYRAV